jgi:ABC-type transport system involved in multi-copper enzyme maturation permease subunit
MPETTAATTATAATVTSARTAAARASGRGARGNGGASASASARGRGNGNGALASVRAELRRLVRWPAVWVVIGAWWVVSLTFGYVFPYVSYRSGETGFSTRGTDTDQLLLDLLPAHAPSVMVEGMPLFGGALMMVLGALASGNGYGWGTWKTVFTQGRSRIVVVGGSIAAVVSLVGLAVLVTVGLDLTAGLAIGAAESADVLAPDGEQLLGSLGGGFAVMAMWALAGYTLGTLTRSPALSVGLGLVWTLVLENLLRGVGGTLEAIESFTHILPGTAAGSLVGSLVEASAGGDSTPGVLTVLPGGQALGTVAVYVVLLLGLTLGLARRRDVT